MISRFTHPKFQIDFRGKELSVVEENHWFNDQFFTKYSFPFDFEVNDELDEALEAIRNIHATSSKKRFEGYLQIFGEEKEAVLTIENIEGTKATGKFRYGFEELPNFDKNLSALPLEEFDLTGSIQSYALGIIDKTYPEVNFNFPQVITNVIDTESKQWQYFEGALNNYSGGSFLLNEYDSANDEQINRNIMQPFPYVLYVLKKAFEDAGFDLAGDILTDPEFKKAVIVMFSDFYSTSSSENQEFLQNTSDYTQVVNRDRILASGSVQVGNYDHTVQILEPGRYKVAGNAILRVDGTEANARLSINGESIWSASFINYYDYREKFYTIDRFFEIGVNEGSADLHYQGINLAYSVVDQNHDPDAMILDVTITKVAGFDNNGVLVPTLVSPNKINLKKCVPDMTVGDLIKKIKNWKNYDLDVNEKVVVMNKIDKAMKEGEVISLEDYEIKNPLRKFYQDKNFILKFQDIDSDEVEFESLYIDSNGTKTSSFRKDENTSEIVIDAYPLPMKQKGTVETAYLFQDNKSQLGLALYDGLTNSLNRCLNPYNLLIPAVYENDYKEWIDFRINAEGVEWTFICGPELAASLKKNSRIYAYKRLYIAERISKKSRGLVPWEITFEGDSKH